MLSSRRIQDFIKSRIESSDDAAVKEEEEEEEEEGDGK